MAMSKKHYEAIAKLMQKHFAGFRGYATERRNVPVSFAKATFASFAVGLADLFQKDNRNFDRRKFIEECCKLTQDEIERRSFSEDF